MSDNFKCIANVAYVCEGEYPKPSKGQCIPPLYTVDLEGGETGYKIIKKIARNYNIKGNQKGRICGSCLSQLGMSPQYSQFYDQNVQGAVNEGLRRWKGKRLPAIYEDMEKDK
ncbi:hypothetical protein ABEU81_26520 [Priestia megaterium]